MAIKLLYYGRYMTELADRKRPRDSADRDIPATADSAATAKTKSSKNTAIFITGLPEDTSLDELVEYFGKYGVIMDDMFTGLPRIKMYGGEGGEFNGEALVVYLREESAVMATDYLNESYFRPNSMIHVERASFSTEQRQADGATSAAAIEELKKVDKKVWKAHMQRMQQKLAWTANDLMSPEEEAAMKAELRRREKYSRIVVLHNMFTRQEYENNITFSLDLKAELMEECERFGTVTAIHVLSDLLAATIKFREAEAAAVCLKVMNGRYFDGRRLIATNYDGSFSLKEKKSSSQAADEEAAESHRLEAFASWLENQENERSPSSHSSSEEPDREEHL